MIYFIIEFSILKFLQLYTLEVFTQTNSEWTKEQSCMIRLETQVGWKIKEEESRKTEESRRPVFHYCWQSETKSSGPCLPLPRGTYFRLYSFHCGPGYPASLLQDGQKVLGFLRLHVVEMCSLGCKGRLP